MQTPSVDVVFLHDYCEMFSNWKIRNSLENIYFFVLLLAPSIFTASNIYICTNLGYNPLFKQVLLNTIAPWRFTHFLDNFSKFFFKVFEGTIEQRHHKKNLFISNRFRLKVIVREFKWSNWQKLLKIEVF